jgi:hypothetical protein
MLGGRGSFPSPRWRNFVIATAMVLSHSAADICLASTLVGGRVSTRPLVRLRGGATQGNASRTNTERIVGVGIGLCKNAASGHVVRRLAPGFPAQQSGHISIKVGFLYCCARLICPILKSLTDMSLLGPAGHHHRHRRRGGQKPQCEQRERVFACDVLSACIQVDRGQTSAHEMMPSKTCCAHDR